MKMASSTSALSLPLSNIPTCINKSQEFPKSTHLSKSSHSHNPLLKTKTPDSKLTKRALLSLTALGLTSPLVLAHPAKAEPEAPIEAASNRMSDLQSSVKKDPEGLPVDLLRKMKEKNVDFAAHPVDVNWGAFLLNFLGNFGVPLVLLGSLLLAFPRTPSGPNLPFGLGRSKAKFQMEPNTGITFDDVAGVDEAKQDFEEIVEFLKTPEKFSALGAKIPKGVLLTGPPGTGKTLLAKAIAGEAGVPFFSLSGSEFIEMFVGVGASRVRDLFNKAKANSPCLVFIDEIDAVGRIRGTGLGGGNDEREQTLNQILTEMDGFAGNTGVLVIAATNRPEILDAALVRPGRFDRQVSVGLPDIRGREEILKVYSKTKKLDKEVSLSVIAMRTPGFSGADLANLMNEAAILAGRRGQEKITPKEIDDSIDRIAAGMEGTKMIDGKSKAIVAYHEVGHAVCATLTEGHDPVQKVTLIPRGQARGLTWFLPGEDPTLVSKQQLFARIVGGLGGRAAEDVIFGEPEITTGAAGDLQQITQIARQMVTMFGMSEIGPWALTDPATMQSDVVLRMLARSSMSEKLAKEIDQCVKKIIDNAYQIAKNHVRNNREAIDKLVDVLLDKETLTGDEFRAILSEYTHQPLKTEDRVRIKDLISMKMCDLPKDMAEEFPASASFFIDEEKKVAVVFDKDTDIRNPTREVAYIIGVDGSLKEAADVRECADRYCDAFLCSYVPSLLCLSLSLPSQPAIISPKSCQNLLIYPNPSTGITIISRKKTLDQSPTDMTALGSTPPLATFLAHPEKAEPEAPIEAASNRMSYSRFLHHLEESEVKKVDLFENGTVAIAEIFAEISNPALRKIQRGLFELPRDYHRELEAELKKMAPINGRAVLVFRAKCGCSVGRLEVPGPKKQLRKIKK
ncbi:hypothetical protein HID58_089062 [Brassica napus]|uniref:AAA+ ATPase domain-containing protein n=2 Tax=Brassica napus TaxID=3708 RepID=A0ABQ7Y0J8_BRANA|nr:hypothetical protein HID58_089062 [Brassica napus]